MKTAGELIRELIPEHYPDGRALNSAVAEHRRLNGLKNWYTAAESLLEEFQQISLLTSADQL